MAIRELELLFEANNKLEELLVSNGLVASFHDKQYPIILTVSQSQDPGDQMELFASDMGTVSARDAKLHFIFQDGEIIVRTDSRLVVPDALLTKIKGLAKKMHYLYLQAYHRQRVEVTENE